MTITIRKKLFRWLVVMSVLSPLSVAIGGVWYTNQVQQEANRQWCDTLNSIDYPGRQAAPGPAGEVLRNIRILRHKYGCDRK